MQTATDLTIEYLTDPTELFQRYSNETDQQRCVLVLDLEAGVLMAQYDPAVGGGVPDDVHHRRTLWLEMPCLTADDANKLLDEAKPLAQRILAGASIEWNENFHIGVLDDDANAAEDQLIALIEEYGDAPTVIEVEASDHYSEGDDPSEELGITADTTDQQLSAMQHTAEKAIADSLEGTIAVTGMAEYLTELRDQLREDAREELERVAKQLFSLTVRRNDLIRQIARWDLPVDTDRAVGDMAGMSHTGVRKIANKIRSGGQTIGDVAATNRSNEIPNEEDTMTTFLATVSTAGIFHSTAGIGVDECRDGQIVDNLWDCPLTEAEVEDLKENQLDFADDLLGERGWTRTKDWTSHGGYRTALVERADRAGAVPPPVR